MFWLGLILGAMAVAAILWPVFLGMRRRTRQLEEDSQLLTQEKQIVVDFMHNMVEAIGEGVNRRALFQRVVNAAVLSTGALSACAFERTPMGRYKGVVSEGLFPPLRPLHGNGTMKAASRAKFIEQVLRSEEYEPGEGLIGAVAQTRRPVLIPHATEDDRVARHEDPSLIIHSLAAAPITFRDRSLGVLAVANPADGQALNETDLSLIHSLAEQAGLAIHNLDSMESILEKNRLDLELSLASGIQEMLLPKRFPKSSELEIDAQYLPARKVGGDLYDIFPLDDHRIGFAVADVSGKGVPASLLMAICQSNLRHIARQSFSPAEVLRTVNATIGEEIRQDMFITVLYAIIDLANDEIVFARAGHELPLIVQRDRESGLYDVAFPGSEGMAIGMVPADLFNEVIEDQRCAFHKGDVLVLYTDGVTEAMNADGSEFGGSRLADVARGLRESPASEINLGILERVNRFAAGRPLHDDLTVVTVRRV